MSFALFILNMLTRWNQTMYDIILMQGIIIYIVILKQKESDNENKNKKK